MGKLKLPKTPAPAVPESAVPAPPPPLSSDKARFVPPPPANVNKPRAAAPSLSRKESKSVPSALTKLKYNADELNSITDKTADMVRDIEAYLSIECKIGFNAAVKYKPSFGPEKSLEYRRIGKFFRISVVDNPIVAVLANQEDAKAWSDCTRAEKIESIKHLPSLIKVITKKVEEDVSRAVEAAETVANVLNSLTMSEG